MALLPTNDYVKFVRGTTKAFNALVNKSNDTLYFVYETGDSTSGKLYLGNKLISGIGEGGTSSLADLADVAISALGTDQILVYNATTGRWENKTLTALDLVVGDEKTITKTAAGTLTINGFEAASVKAIPVKSEEGTLVWQAPADVLKTLNVYTKDEINAKLTGSLSRVIVASTDDIDLTAEDAENHIYLVPNDKGTYDEYMVINGALEKVGDWEVNLENYVTKEEVGNLVTENFNSIVINQIGSLTNYGGENLTLVDKVEEIDGRLKWNEITE